MTRSLLRFLNTPILILIVAIAVAVQSSLFSPWPLPYLQPDVVLLAVIWCALKRDFGEGGVITLILAEITEIHSAAPQGVFLISYMAVYLIVRGASRFIVIPSLFSYAMIALASSIFWKLSGLVILFMLGIGANQLRHTLTFLLLGAAIESFFSIWVFKWLDRLDWITFKNQRAEHLVEEELQLDSEGL